MNRLITKLFDAFKVNDPVSLLVEYSTSNKSEKSLRELVESASLMISEIIDDEFSSDEFHQALQKGFIAECKLPANAHGYYMSIKGLVHYLESIELDWQEPLILALQHKRLPELSIKLKKEERLFVFVLLMFGATNENKALRVSNNDVKNRLYSFLQEVDEHGLIRRIFNDKTFSWGKGKKISWTKFLTEWIDLPKTGLYKKISREGVDYFYIDLSTTRNIGLLRSYLIEDNSVDVTDRHILHDYIREKSNHLAFEVNIGYFIEPISDDILRKLLI